MFAIIIYSYLYVYTCREVTVSTHVGSSRACVLYSPTTLIYSICRPSCGEEGLNRSIDSSECSTGTSWSGGSSAPGSFDHGGNVSYMLQYTQELTLLHTHYGINAWFYWSWCNVRCIAWYIPHYNIIIHWYMLLYNHIIHILCYKEPLWLYWPLLPLSFSLPHAGSTGLQRETIFVWRQQKSQLCSVAHSRALLRTLLQVRSVLKDQFCSSLTNTILIKPILPSCFKFLCLLMVLVLCTVTQLCGHLTIGVYQTNWMHYI